MNFYVFNHLKSPSMKALWNSTDYWLKMLKQTNKTTLAAEHQPQPPPSFPHFQLLSHSQAHTLQRSRRQCKPGSWNSAKSWRQSPLRRVLLQPFLALLRTQIPQLSLSTCAAAAAGRGGGAAFERIQKTQKFHPFLKSKYSILRNLNSQPGVAAVARQVPETSIAFRTMPQHSAWKAIQLHSLLRSWSKELTSSGATTWAFAAIFVFSPRALGGR